MDKETFKCSFCDKEYKRVTTLATHKCKVRDRLDTKGTTAFRFAFLAFNYFYDWSFPRSRPKSEIDFVKSSYFDEFHRYGEYMASVKINDLKKYTHFLLSKNIPLKFWTDEKIYTMYLYNTIKTEPPETAVERTINTMERWAKDSNRNICDYFNTVDPQIVFTQIKRGNLSPWVLYNTSSGKRFVKRLNPVHLEMLYDIIDPDYWVRTFDTKKVEVNAISSVLKAAGL